MVELVSPRRCNRVGGLVLELEMRVRCAWGCFGCCLFWEAMNETIQLLL